MIYAHIFKSRGGKFCLTLTDTPAISSGMISKSMHESKSEAKAAAKAVGAKPHNY